MLVKIINTWYLEEQPELGTRLITIAAIDGSE